MSWSSNFHMPFLQTSSNIRKLPPYSSRQWSPTSRISSPMNFDKTLTMKILLVTWPCHRMHYYKFCPSNNATITSELEMLRPNVHYLSEQATWLYLFLQETEKSFIHQGERRSRHLQRLFSSLNTVRLTNEKFWSRLTSSFLWIGGS